MWQKKVRARVLRHDTPLEVRKEAAGDNQFAQKNFSALKLSDWCRLFLQTEADLPFEQRLAKAVRQSGYDRPATEVCYKV